MYCTLAVSLTLLTNYRQSQLPLGFDTLPVHGNVLMTLCFFVMALGLELDPLLLTSAFVLTGSGVELH